MRQINGDIAGRKDELRAKTIISTYVRSPKMTYWRTDNGAIRIQSIGDKR